MKLYIIRHGQTDWNIAKKIQGRQDIPLNERGHFQAQCLGKAMENRPITAVFSSPQIRAMETAIAVASPAGVPVIPVRDLMEINYGVWEGKTEEEKLYLRLLLVTDYVCGMTDSYAKRLYQEMNGII